MIKKHLSFANSAVRTGSVAWAVAVSLIASAWPTSSDALSLGRSRGAAVLGRPLDVSVLATLEPQEAVPEASCFSAEVFYGDNRVNATSVTVTPLRTGPTELTLRVRSSTPIDEAFVTVYMRTVCGPSYSRRYVLLSDSPSEPAAAAPLPNLPLLGAPTAPPAPRAPAAPVESSNATGNATDSTAAAARAQQREERRQAARQAAASPEAIARAQARKQAREQAREQAKAQAAEREQAKPRSPMSTTLGKSTPPDSARLKVDLLDFSAGGDPRLRSSSEMLSQPAADNQVRAKAAAMWRAINASPDDILRDVERLKTIEADVLAMSQLTKQQTQELKTLKTELAQAQRGRYSNPFVYGLGALTLAALAFAVWAWRRSRNAERVSAAWWSNAQSAGPDDGVVAGDRTSTGGFLTSRSGSTVSELQKQRDQDRERSFVEASTLVAPATGPAPLAATVIPRMPPLTPEDFRRSGGQDSRSTQEEGPSDFGVSVTGVLRPVNAEELFDIQQQADFFMSLGQHNQAIDILQNHISDNVETSALAYLDLFDIYHKVGLRDEFADLRDEFNRVFNAQVPEYDLYGIRSRGLEEYLPAVERIQALWPNPKVLEVIEESIFRKPDRDNQPFDLLAYRELMLLYAIAKDVSENDSVRADLEVDFDVSQPPEMSAQDMLDMDATWGSSTKPHPGFSGTEVQPLSAALSPVIQGLNRGQNEEPVDDWEEALKKLPLASKSDEVDVDLELPIGAIPANPPAPDAPSAPPASPPAPADNSIDFEVVPKAKRPLGTTKPGKLF